MFWPKRQVRLSTSQRVFARFCLTAFIGARSIWLKRNLFPLLICCTSSLLFRYYNYTNRERFLSERHVSDSSDKACVNGKVSICQICFEESKLMSINCGHAFCKNCWKNYIRIKVCLALQSIEVVCCLDLGRRVVAYSMWWSEVC